MSGLVSLRTDSKPVGPSVLVTWCRTPDGSSCTVGEHERRQPSQAALVLVVVVVHLGPEVARRAVARHDQRGGGRRRDERARRRAEPGGQPGASEVVVDEVDVPAQSELGRQEPEVVLAGDQVGRGRHMDQDVDFGGVDPGVGEGGAPGSERQITVVEAAVGAAPLASPAEVVVQPPLMDAEVLDDPLGLERPTVRANGTEVLEDLLVGDPAVRQDRSRHPPARPTPRTPTWD